jgi:hypothetical protein
MQPTSLATLPITLASLTTSLTTLAAAFAFSGLAAAQTVDYPSSTLANPPQVTFPFYTPGAGSTGQTVRAQFLCGDAFLAQQSLSAGLVTRIGFSLAGEAVYDTFELRAGVTTETTLGSDWAVNLPDQRMQRNLSNMLIVGGGTASAPVNQWVELELDFPFYWQPGQNIVVDLTTHVATPGITLGTTVGVGVPRAYNFSYGPGALANAFSGNGVAFRMVFASTDLVPFGTGCAATGGTVPSLTSQGPASLGGAMLIFANDTLETTIGGFLFGFSRREIPTGALPLDLGGGCTLLVAPDVFVPSAITPIGGGFGTAGIALTVPADPLLAGAVVYTQWAQLDAGSPAIVPLTFSHAGAVVVF